MATATLTHPSVKDMTAVSKDSGIEPLGYIVWFSVPDQDVSLRRVRKQWGLAGLDMAVVPAEPKQADAFKRAVRAQESRVREPNGNVIETDVREVDSDTDTIVYQLSRVVRDRQERIVNYPKALKVTYRKYDGELDFQPLGQVNASEVLPMIEAIQAAYEANGKAIPGPKVRSLVRDFIKDDSHETSGKVGLSGENLRGKAGGVYFVLARFGEQLDALAEFLSNVYPDGRAYLYTVPMADGASEREMIRRHHVNNSIAEAEEAINEARLLMREERKRGIRENVRKHHFAKLERARMRTAMYSDALRSEQEDVQMRLEVLNRQLRKVLGV